MFSVKGPDVRPAEISAALDRAGTTQLALAEELGVSKSAVSLVVRGKSRSQRIEERIAQATDIPLYRLFPDWYTAPAGLPTGFEPDRINVDLLETVERQLIDELSRLIPGLPPYPPVKARHRCEAYNACIAAGSKAIETSAGTKAIVKRFVDEWVTGYERFNGAPPTGDAVATWALYVGPRHDESERLSASERKIAAAGTVINQGDKVTVGKQINLTGEKQTLVLGNKIGKQVITKP